MLIPAAAEGYAGVYHENNPPGWAGPTGFYKSDYRFPPGPEEGETWDSVYVWADPTYLGTTMFFSLQSDSLFPPPRERDYLLELLGIPDGVSGAPPVGTVWRIPLGENFAVELPTHRTTNGLEGYQFAFTVTAVVPEPVGASLWALGLAVLAWCRRRGAG